MNASAAAAWGKGGKGLTHTVPDTISKMEGAETKALTAWVKVKAVVARL